GRFGARNPQRSRTARAGAARVEGTARRRKLRLADPARRHPAAAARGCVKRQVPYMFAAKIRADAVRPEDLGGMKEQLSSRELQTFVLLANSPSFTVAADTLHITQSALSKRIAELENKLGVRLFDRTTRQLDLTMEGREFLSMAVSLLEHMERSVTELRQTANGQRGRLWVTAAPHMSSTLIPPVLAAFAKANPMVNINYYDCRREEMQRHITAGSAEFGIIGGVIGQDH